MSEQHAPVNARCPRCGSPAVIPIAYGLPAGPEVFEEAERGELELGGCVIADDSPGLRCTDCGHGFSRLEFSP